MGELVRRVPRAPAAATAIRPAGEVRGRRHRRRRADPGRAGATAALRGWHPVDLAGRRPARPGGAQRHRPGRGRRRDRGLRRPGGRAGAQRRRASPRWPPGSPTRSPAPRSTASAARRQQAVHFAAQGVMAGAYDVAIAAGVESMTRVPMWSNVPERPAAYGPRVRARYGLAPDALHRPGRVRRDRRRPLGDHRGRSSTRFALESHRRAARATEEGRFAGEILPVAARGPTTGARAGGRRRGHPARHEPGGAGRAGARLPAGRAG